MSDRFKDFTHLIANVGRTINRIKNIEMKQFGLKGTQVNCLFYLYESDGKMTAREICIKSAEDKGAISRELKELEESGFIESENDENKKKYNCKLKLTEKGNEVAQYIEKKIDSILNYDKNFISDEELSGFYKTFNKIYDNLRNISTNYGEKND